MSLAAETRPLAERLRHLPTPLALSGVLLIVLPAVGWVLDGPVGAVGAAMGVLIVAGGYLLSSVTVAWADLISPNLVLTVGLASYLFKVSLLGVALLGVMRADWAGSRMMAIAMVAAIVGWVGAQTWWTARHGAPSAAAGAADRA